MEGRSEAWWRGRVRAHRRIAGDRTTDQLRSNPAVSTAAKNASGRYLVSDREASPTLPGV
jgi:hypothetical protein